MMIRGGFERFSERLIWSAASSPFITGITRSINTILKGSCSSALPTISIASAAVTADSTLKPKWLSCSTKISSALSLSSTTKTLVSASALTRSTRERRALSPSRSSGKGTSKKKVLPLPGSLSTAIEPPMSSTNWREIARPSPVPPYCRVVPASA